MVNKIILQKKILKPIWQRPELTLKKPTKLADTELPLISSLVHNINLDVAKKGQAIRPLNASVAGPIRLFTLLWKLKKKVFILTEARRLDLSQA
jgi:hypothetical protein